jgi:hypothetical protein
MSNPTIEQAQVDIGNFMAAKSALNLPGVATDTDSNIAMHAKCRMYIVEHYPSVTLPAPILAQDYYTIALVALNKANELVMAQASEPGYRPGVLFRDDESYEKRELAPLPPSPNDPFQRQDAREAQHRIDEMFYEVMGRTLSPAERLVESKRVELGKPEQFNEYEEVGRTINGRFYVDHGRTAEKRAENRRKNEALRKKK